MISRPNDLPHHRLALITPKKVGSAVRRNRVKRELREAFRLMQHELPGHYDVLLVIRPHEATSLGEYQRLLSYLFLAAHNQKR